jgi:hypothetical protein
MYLPFWKTPRAPSDWAVLDAFVLSAVLWRAILWAVSL